MTRKTLRPLAALLGAVAVLLLGAAPAAAHGGPGEIEVTSSTRDGDQVTVTVHLKYVEDGHGVPDATVTAVVDEGTPVPMEAGAEEGDYSTTVTATEGATIRVTSVEPATSVEAPAPGAGDEATTTSVAEETTTTEAPASTEATTTTAAADTETDAAPTTEATAAEGDDDGGSSTGLIIGAVVAIVAAAGVIAALVLWKKPDGTTDLDG